jgi:hypothetical protein
MKSIERIITETINNYVNNIIAEAEEGSAYQQAEDRAEKHRRKMGNNLATSDEESLRDALESDTINLAAVARKVYPEHTKEGAQSQLRKKIKGVKNDNGDEYHLKEREASIIRQEMNKIKR